MWVSKKEHLSIKKMVEDHERDLKEQLETNRKMGRVIEELKASVKELSEDASRSDGGEKKVGLSKDKKYVTYNLELIQEVMHYLKDTDTDKSKELLGKLICPCPRNADMDKEEQYLRSLTEAERKEMLYGNSFPKDSETL